ncbi:MAG: hypothetical protein ACI9MR_001903 [Myxococcota bacterium]|jgi:hypothetical protein
MMLILLSAGVAHMGLVGGCASDPEVAPCPVCPTGPNPDAGTKEKAAKAPLDYPAPTRDRGRLYQFRGFSKDGSKFAVQTTDEAVGNAFLIYDAATEKPVKTYVFASIDESATWRRAKRRYKIVDDATHSQIKPGDSLMVFAGDTADHVVLYAMEGERAVPYLQIPRLRGDDDQPAEVSVPFVGWEASGRYIVMIHRQTLTDPHFQSEYINVIEMEDRRLPF